MVFEFDKESTDDKVSMAKITSVDMINGTVEVESI
jgi:hypothetical protein